MERRLAAIVVTDAVGYSSLMHRDEAGAFNAIVDWRKVIEPLVVEYAGRIFKFTGDGALIEFPSVVDAVNFSMKMQQEIAARNKAVPAEEQLGFRIGINVGDIIVQPDDIYGDGINVAARLQQIAEPGSVYVAETVYEHANKKVPFRFDYIGSKKVKNIDEPMRLYVVKQEDSAPAPAAADQYWSGSLARNLRKWKGRKMAIATSVVGIAAAILAISVAELGGPSRQDGARPNLSIAVMPFVNMTENAGYAAFADGITEDITTDLSQIAALLVVSTNSTFQYKNKTVDPEDVSRELGVHYIVDGSVRRDNDFVRVNAKLIDGSNGTQVWADRFDAKLTQMFDMQDRMTRRIVQALAVRLSDAETETVSQSTTTSIELYEAYHTGWQYFRKNTPDNLKLALQYFNKALEYDPENARALAAIGYVYLNSWLWGWEKDVGATWNTALDLARQYLDKSSAHPTAIGHQLAAQLATYGRKHDIAIAEAGEALTLDPNEPNGLLVMAEALIFGGRPNEAKPFVEKAMQVDPLNPAYSNFLRGMISFCESDYSTAIEYFQTALKQNPDDFGPAAPMAAAYAQLNRDEDMKAAIKTYLAGWSDASIDMFRTYWPWKDEEVEGRLLAGLRKAGLPE